MKHLAKFDKKTLKQVAVIVHGGGVNWKALEAEFRAQGFKVVTDFGYSRIYIF